MTLIKTPQEIKILREGGKILSRILALLAKRVKPGVSTWELELLAREEIRRAGAKSAFQGYQISRQVPPYPAALCTSVDHEIVHCIPSQKRVLKEGQIIGLDLGIEYRGFFTDSAMTVPVGKVSRKAQKLLAATKEALEKGIKEVKPGKTIGDIAFVIQKTGETAGFGVIHDLTGHGVGHSIHEDPCIPNYGQPKTLGKLVPGMVIAIEPMFTTGSRQIKFLDDGWTVVTADGSLSAHFEHTVAVTAHGHLVLTA